MIRWKFTQTTRFNVPFRVEIYDTEYGGSEQELTIAGGHPVERDIGTPNADYLEKIKSSFLSVRLRGEKGDFGDLFDRNNSRFLIKFYVDGDLEDEFIPIPDTFSEPVTAGSYEITIRGANLSLLKQVKISDILDLEGERISVLSGIYQIVSHFFSMPLVDGSIYYPDGASQSTSALSQYTFRPDRFENETAYDALQALIPHGHQIRASRGKFFIFSPGESSFVGYEYDGSTIGAGVTYADNFEANKIGGRLSAEKSMQRAYDGVNSIYDAGETPNLIADGDIRDAEFDTYAASALTDGGEKPEAWQRTAGMESTRTDAGAWRIEVPPDQAQYFFTAFFSSLSIINGQRFRLSIDGFYSNAAKKDTTIVLLFRVKIGDYFLINSGTDFTDLFWTKTPPTLASGVGDYLRVPMQTGNQTRFEAFTPPLPETGLITNRITFGVFTANQSTDNYVDITKLALDPVDDNGEITTKTEDLAGEDGDVYEFTDIFGDGFSSVSEGALFYDNAPTESWGVKGLTGSGSIAEQKAKYLFSELKRDRERIIGTVDTFDTIALINGYRVNYSSTDYRYGRSRIELVEIEEHDLTATVEERKEKDNGLRLGVGVTLPPELMPFSQNAIGVTTSDYDKTKTSTVDCELDSSIRAGFAYWIINKFELDPDDRYAGIYEIIPLQADLTADAPPTEYGPGLLEGADALDIEEQIINAPSGSVIVKAAGQEEINSKFPEFSFVSDTLEIVEDTLRSSMDLIEDGTTFAKVIAAGVDSSGNIIMGAIEGDIDDIADGVTYSRVLGTSISAGKILIVEAVGDLDDIDNGGSFAKVSITSITAGKIVLAETVGDIDDISDGTTYGRILTTSISSGKIVLAEGVGDLDDIANGGTFARVKAAVLTVDGLVVLASVDGDIDDVSDGATYKKVNATSVSATGVVIVSGLSGDLDDLADGATYGKIKSTDLSAGRILIKGLNDQTVIEGGVIDTNEVLASNATITALLTMGTDGKITNTGGDFTTNSDGYSVFGTASFLEKSSYSLFNTAGTDPSLVVGYISSFSGTVFLRSENGFDLSVTSDEDLAMTAFNNIDIRTGSGGVTTLNENGVGHVAVNGLPTSDPSIAGRWFTRTATQLGGSGTTKVLCVS